MKIKKIGIVANIEKEKIADHVKSLKKWLEEKGVEVFWKLKFPKRLVPVRDLNGMIWRKNQN